MSINSDRVANKVIKKLKSIGIDDKVGIEESHTAKMIRLIIDAILEEIVNNGEVVIHNLPVSTPIGPGLGNGKGDII